MFAGTLRENIGLGDAERSRERILEAARRVGADRVIARRPEGLDAPVLERGANFSAGERQLVAFARALARDPEILILDEATASVDPETERVIERGIGELMRGRTSIVIAHRLSTVQRASRIIAVHHGRIAEEGKHDELLAQDGIYARLYRLQMMGHGAAGASTRLDAAESANTGIFAGSGRLRALCVRISKDPRRTPGRRGRDDSQAGGACDRARATRARTRSACRRSGSRPSTGC